ncbi:MAG: hypothetical protein SFX73_08570 [Kofleriaceae bacterium]|nr:hypothetical protein [Kofleriaceae bacterium]
MMDHLAQPLERLFAAAGAFVGGADARLLYVPVDDELFDGARDVAASLEWHPDNTRPLVLLRTAYAPRSAGWEERTAELRDAYERLANAFQEKAVNVPELPTPDDPSAAPVTTFGRTLVTAAQPFAPGEDTDTDGLLVVLAPESLDDAVRLLRELRDVVSAPPLLATQWILLHRLGGAEPVDAGAALGIPVEVHGCRVDRALQAREMDALVTRMRAAAQSGANLGPPGGARPRIVPPPHPADPIGEAPLEVAAAAPHPLFLDAVLATAQALRRGAAPDAFEPLRRACEACVATGRVREAVDLEVLLASIAAGVLTKKGELHPQVKAVFASAGARAEAAGLKAESAVAHLMFGCAAMAQQDGETAIRAFVTAATAAEEAKLPAVRFQSLRLAGDMAASAGLDERARAFWTDALETYRTMPEVEAEAFGLVDAARELEPKVAPGGEKARVTA